MSINKAEQTIEKRLVNTISANARELRQIKGVQPVGADILSVDSTALVTGTVSVPAGTRKTAVVTITPNNSTLTLWNFSFSSYIDVDNVTNIYPNGTAFSASSDQLKMMVWGWFDWADSSDTTNVRVFKIRYDATNCLSDHTVYVKFKAYLPRLSGTTAH